MKNSILILVFTLFVLTFSACNKDDKDKDVNPPVITLLGSNPVAAEKDQVYVDAGATALDDVDGDITSSIEVINLVNPNVEGTYTVSYNVSDAAGNKAVEIVRTVNVMVF